MNVNDDFLWVEKHRPQSINECILPDHLKNTFQEFVDQEKVPNLLLTGTPGVGKTTVAKAMLNEIESDFMMINGSNEGRLIETLRVPITQYATTTSLNGNRKYVIIDEADYVNANSVQPALRSFMEEFSKNCGFILTCNFENRIVPALHSRCSVVRFNLTKADRKDMAIQFFNRCKKVLKSEGVEFDGQVVANLIQKHMPDWRRVLNELQRASVSGKIDATTLADNDAANFKTLVGYLSSKEFTNVRKWVAVNYSNDFETLCRQLYDQSHKIMEPESIPQLVVTLADYQYKQNFVADPEINCMAMLTEIMMECNFKE